MNNNSYPSVNPIKSKNYKYIEVVEIGLEIYYAVVFNEAHGVNLDINYMAESQFECWGKTLAFCIVYLKLLALRSIFVIVGKRCWNLQMIYYLFPQMRKML